MARAVPKPLVEYGPPGFFHFPSAVNVFSIEEKGGRVEIGVAVDDGSQSTHLRYAVHPGGRPAVAPLNAVQFKHGKIAYTVARVSTGARAVTLEFLDGAGEVQPTLSCTFDLVARSMRELPAMMRLALEMGPPVRGKPSRAPGGTGSYPTGTEGKGDPPAGEVAGSGDVEAPCVSLLDVSRFGKTAAEAPSSSSRPSSQAPPVPVSTPPPAGPPVPAKGLPARPWASSPLPEPAESEEGPPSEVSSDPSESPGEGSAQGPLASEAAGGGGDAGFGGHGVLAMPSMLSLAGRSDAGVELVIDDGGRVGSMAAIVPDVPTVRRELLRATPGSPAYVRFDVPTGARQLSLYSFDQQGKFVAELSCHLDLPAQTFAPARVQAGIALEEVGETSIVCLACRRDRPITEAIGIEELSDDEQRLLRKDHVVTWEFSRVCRECLQSVRVKARAAASLQEKLGHLFKLLSALSLFFKAYLGALSVCFPLGELTFAIIRQNVAFLGLAGIAGSKAVQFTIFLNTFTWALLFAAIPFRAVTLVYVRFFSAYAQSSPVSLAITLGTQAALAWGAWTYGGLYRLPAYAHPPGGNVFLWKELYLYAAIAALLRVILADASQSAVQQFEVGRKEREKKSSRGNELVRNFHSLLMCYEERDLLKVLREILTERFEVTEYQIWEFDAQAKVFRPRLSFGRRLEELQGMTITPGEPNYLGHAGMFNELYGEHTLRQRKEYRHAFRKPPVPSQVAGAIRIDGEIRGILNIGRFLRGSYDRVDAEQLASLMNILGVAMKNCDVFTKKEEELVASKEETQKQILEKDFIKGVFGKYVSPRLVEKILNEPKYAKLIAEKAELTILFTDLAGFTTISERLGDPSMVASILNDYLTEMTAIIFRHSGTLDKYMGDGIMAFYGRPLELKDHALQACLTALEMRDRVADLKARFKEEMGAELSVRMGINTGEVVVGNMGSKMAFGYTVIGDAVNLAARLEPTNKEYGTHLMISEFTYAKVGDRVLVRPVDRIRVKGKTRPVMVYELLADATTGLTHQQELLVDLYARGLSAYFNQHWAEAEDLMTRALQVAPGDGPAQVILDRLQSVASHPPPAGWDGVYDSKVK